jgi:protein involved in polysaccharide export with SLBB domain
MRRSILVEGAVARAGLYDYNPRFGILAYVAHAGGLSRTARDVDEIKIVRPNGATFPYRSTTKPEPGDTILVPERHFSRAEIVQIVIAGAGLVLSGAALYISATR